jgi:hypothetical protein
MKLIIAGVFVLLLLTGCKKESDNWEWCTDCNSQSVAGQYIGIGTYQNSVNDLVLKEQPVYLNITDLGNGSINIQTGIINRFFMGISGGYNDTYYLTISNNTQLFNITFFKNGNQLKITGTALYFDGTIIVDGQEVRNTIDLIDFEVFPVSD